MKRLLLAAAAGLAMLGSTAAMARVNVDISVGVPGVIYSTPDYYYPPVRYVAPPRVIIVPERRYRPVYGPRYYREGYREARYDRNYYKQGNRHHDRGHRGR
ncbi:MAG: hypothetical protein ACTS5Y_05190 [Pollutimonas bauzanensis]|uniref:PXPV repeat-containing protein n=1 Tax=Pollutimonas bauzanensis TaxID=658167 RepID=A0A1M5YX93_9BURK|nr:hypothetical protein [Pollutimonas bauzanensis]SHI16575.1 hypothetical protein SAMN04488135_11129 [Pollutimonas bauzanensis]